MVIDIVCIIIFITLLFNGYKNGFVKETFSLLKYILLLYVFNILRGNIPRIQEFFRNRYDINLTPILIYIVVICVAFIIFTVIAHILTTILESIGLGRVNKLLGIVVAFIKSMIIIMIGYIMMFLPISLSNSMPFGSITGLTYNMLLESKVADTIEDMKIAKYILPNFMSKTYDKYYIQKQKDKLKNELLQEYNKSRKKNNGVR